MRNAEELLTTISNISKNKVEVDVEDETQNIGSMSQLPQQTSLWKTENRRGTAGEPITVKAVRWVRGVALRGQPYNKESNPLPNALSYRSSFDTPEPNRRSVGAEEYADSTLYNGTLVEMLNVGPIRALTTIPGERILLSGSYLQRRSMRSLMPDASNNAMPKALAEGMPS